MVHYLTAKELLKLAIPGFPGTERGIKWRADKESWPSRPRKGHGGGVEYEVRLVGDSFLTPDQQDHVRKVLVQQAEASGTPEFDAEAAGREAARELVQAKEAELARAREVAEAGLVAAQTLPAKAQDRMHARLEVLRLWTVFWKGHQPPISLQHSEFRFADAYNGYEVEVPGWVREAIPSISQRTLARWRKAQQEGGIAALGGAGGRKKGGGAIDTNPALQKFIVGLIAGSPHAQAAHVHTLMKTAFKDDDCKLPSLRRLQEWMTAWRTNNAQTLLAVSNPDAWKNKYMVAFGNASEDITQLNQRWELDSTPADILLADNRRYHLVGAVDVYSRRMMLLVTPTSKATAVAALLRRCLLSWGVPLTVKTDNGSDYTSKHITGVLGSLNIHQELCPPFQPWHKPHIERAFRTFSHSFLELLPGFIGHNVTERKAIESQKSFAEQLFQRGKAVQLGITPEELQLFCDNWCEGFYNHEPHSNLGGLTPAQVAAEWPFPITPIKDERALDVLLAEAPNGGGLRTVTKKGLRIDGASFIAPELEEFVAQQVVIKLDPLDYGHVYVFRAEDFSFICKAVCPERTGVSRQEVAAKASAIQKQRRTEERRRMREAAKSVDKDELVRLTLEDKAEAAGKLVRFTPHGDAHETPALLAAADAVEAEHREPSRQAEADEAGRQLIVRFDAERQARAELEAPLDKYQRLLGKADQGLELTDTELRFMSNYEKTPEYRGWLSFQQLQKVNKES